MFYFKCENLDVRTRLITFLKKREIAAVFHYIPLHTAPAGLKYGRFDGKDLYTTVESERLLRLPLYYGMDETDLEIVCSKIEEFYQ